MSRTVLAQDKYVYIYGLPSVLHTWPGPFGKFTSLTTPMIEDVVAEYPVPEVSIV